MTKKPATAAKTGKSGARTAAKVKPRASVEAVAKPKALTTAQRLDAIGIEAICAMIEDGQALRAIAKHCGMTTWPLQQWLDGHKARYAQAREAQADKFAQEIIEISDEADVITKHEGETVTLALDATAVARNRLRIDSRKWLAAKMNNGKYGDKTVQEITGANGGPVQQSISVSFVKP
jgi:hypothetical protein